MIAIRVGGRYQCKIADKLIVVEVDRAWEVQNSGDGYETRASVVEVATGKHRTIRDQALFVRELSAPPPTTRPRPVLGHPTPPPPAAVVPTAVPPKAAGRPVPPKLGVSALLQQSERADRHVSRPHCLVIARAGTGKTTTLLAGICWMYRNRIPYLWQELTRRSGGRELEPSPQQAAVWEAMALSADARTVTIGAFNRTIVAEFRDKWGWIDAPCKQSGVYVGWGTMHSIGFQAVRKVFRLDADAVNEHRTALILAELLGRDLATLRREEPVLLKAVEQLVSKCKVNRVPILHLDTELGDSFASVQGYLRSLSSKYEIETGDPKDWERVCSLVPRVLHRSLEVGRDGCVDHDDMIWLPCQLQLPVFVSDLFLGDEVQDWSQAQQTLARMSGRRLVLVGDDRQAIYGFSGADSDSIPRQRAELEASDRGLAVIPLTVTRRCGRAIVAEARRFVPDFSAHPSCPPGSVVHASYTEREERTVDGEIRKVQIPWADSYGPLVRAGDFVLCRANAPLVSQCLKFLGRGIRATILGRADVGQRILDLVERLGAATVPPLIERVSRWRERETANERAKMNPSQQKIESVADLYECVISLSAGAEDVPALRGLLEKLFTADPHESGVRLSSVHRAKGLEAKRVFILDVCRERPKMQDWERQQLDNLRYVAITRAIEYLCWVS